MARSKPLGPKTVYYTVREAAELLDCGGSTLYRAVKKRQVPHHIDPIRGYIRFTDSDLREIEAMGARPLDTSRARAA